ncbi:urea ABC transporter permease subunit UrtB [Halovulum dunhuangense]|uniref:Urea ABC transporter permease subunit UrtB n=1 Tax=Halovulum dunhuangense TaxID=1505036 RepID=A0A849L670_9RHOB|nr:urea ABC transporter permease subunit UrtB [Halovulum dunhuangense]NNU81998.1 urea ABC transporter permease subunit UrtB [Halovulum dunhuangense]
MLRILLIIVALLAAAPAHLVRAQGLQEVLQPHAEEVANPSRQRVAVVLDALIEAGHPGVSGFLERWQNREVVLNRSDGLFYYAGQASDGQIALLDIETGQDAGRVPASAIQEIRPNGGVRREIAGALVQFQLSAPDIVLRRDALDTIGRSPSADHMEPLAASLEDETDTALRIRKARLLGLLQARFAETTEGRVAAIEGLAGDVSVDVRATLNQILATSAGVAPQLPAGNIARLLEPGSPELSRAEAYARLVESGLAPPRIPAAQIRDALVANVVDGRAGGIAVGQLDTEARRLDAYAALAAAGTVPPTVSEDEVRAALDAHVFYLAYADPDAAVTRAAARVLAAIERRVAFDQALDLALDALSLSSIYFLAAIGLAITFGVMGVINMAHGEFIMMGAYTGYVVQLFIPDYTLALIVALPLAFAVTFGAGVAMERLVIRWLYHRPLETLLATFGISIALQQLAKNIFGTQARPLTAPGWLDGALVYNEVIQISHIRIAIFFLALMFLGLILFVLNRTRLGLEVRAVTQNPGMAASMGINPDRINMLTFGLGSGIAGIAGVAIGLYAKVTSEMGQDYIVQSFMTVVVGGVGNVWGTLAGAVMIGTLQKGIEWMNPSNTLAAQTYMILFIILFIQFRPKGIVALKGRAAEA